jgi:sodium/hydrogen exchanger-like protein 6/7
MFKLLVKKNRSVFTEALKDYEENVAECEGNCTFSAVHIVKAVAYFFGIFGASFLVGSVMGCITALLTKFTHIR